MIDQTLTGWPGLVLLGLVALGWGLRRVAPQSHWFHNATGAAIIVGAQATISAVIAAIQTKGLHFAVVENAALSAMLGALAIDNPTTKAPPANEVVALKSDKGAVDTRLLLGLGGVGLGVYFLAVLLAGCAPEADGLRQACANADHVITSGYQTVVTWDHSENLTLRALARTNPKEAQAQLDSHCALANQILAALNHAVADKKKACDQAWDENAKLDWGVLVQATLQVMTDVRTALVAVLPKPSRLYWPVPSSRRV